VVIRENGVESVSEPTSYSEAVAEYEKKAHKINSIGKDGSYLYPQMRISVRKIGS